MDREKEIAAALENRINDLESTLAHQQREYELLNQVVVEQAQTVERLERRLTSLESSLESVQTRLPDDRDPLSEKPPHY